MSLRTVERAVQTWQEALRQSRQATVRCETRPGKQLQAAFARHWGFSTKACWPNRPQTKDKDERVLGYLKRGGLAGHRFDTWG